VTTITCRDSTTPDALPITIGELEQQIGVSLSDSGEADFGLSLIAAAVEHIETHTGIAMITRDIVQTVYTWPIIDMRAMRTSSRLVSPSYVGDRMAIELCRWPVVSLADITIEGESMADRFELIADRQPPAVALKSDALWQAASKDLIITYRAGYGDAPSAVPRNLRLAVAMLAANLYAHRGDECATPDPIAASGVAPLLRQYRKARL
jgi:hypothetical protein